MRSVSDTCQAQTETDAGANRSQGHGDAAVGAPTRTPVVGPARVMALQRAIGNASVARLAGGAAAGPRARPAPAPPVSPSQAKAQAGAVAIQQAVLARRAAEGGHPAAAAAASLAPAPARSGRRLARGFWGKLWGGVKSVGSAIGSGAKAVAGAVKTAAVATAGAVKDAAVAVGGAVKTAAVATAGAVKDAASWVWEGAKAVGQWAVDWLSKAGAAVWEAMKWFGEHAWIVIKAIGATLFEKLALLGTLAFDFIHFLPFRLWHMVIQGWEAISGMFYWLWKGLKDGPSWSWVWEGFKGALFWTIDTLIRAMELFGITDALQLVWGLVFHTRNLNKEEIEASEKVHGKGLIQYWQVRLDSGSYLVKLGKWLNSFKDPNAGERAVTTMHIIQAPKDMDLQTTVHELTHVAQYERIGAVYMPQALHGQASEMGYDYGDLVKARAEGRRYRDFNREQQAQIAEDYYVVTELKKTPRYKGTEAALLPFIEEMRRGEF